MKQLEKVLKLSGSELMREPIQGIYNKLFVNPNKQHSQIPLHRDSEQVLVDFSSSVPLRMKASAKNQTSVA